MTQTQLLVKSRIGKHLLNFIFSIGLVLFVVGAIFCSIPALQTLYRIDSNMELGVWIRNYLSYCGLPLTGLFFLTKMSFRNMHPVIRKYGEQIKLRTEYTIKNWKPFLAHVLLKYLAFSGLISLLLFVIFAEISYGSALLGLYSRPQDFFVYWLNLFAVYLSYGLTLFIVLEISRCIVKTVLPEVTQRTINPFLLILFQKGYYVSIVLLLAFRFIE